jgi:hypothetical protein
MDRANALSDTEDPTEAEGGSNASGADAFSLGSDGEDTPSSGTKSKKSRSKARKASKKLTA